MFLCREKNHNGNIDVVNKNDVKEGLLGEKNIEQTDKNNGTVKGQPSSF